MEDRNAMQTKLVPGVGRLPYPAYRGNEPYIFISYARLDKDKVYAEIKRFNDAGFHVWYDEGITPGNEWSDEIAQALSNCAVFVVLLTPSSAPREAVLNEISFALDEGKPFLAIYLEGTELPPGLRLRISRKQAILKYNMTDEEYEFKYIEAFTKFGLKQTYVPVVNTFETKREEPVPVKENTDPAEKKDDNISIKQLDERVKNFLGVSQIDAAKTEAEFYDDSPEDAKKRANGDLVRINGFDIEHGLLRGYYGSEKDITVPLAARIIGSRAFDRCRLFIESVDLNNARKIISGMFGVFSNCPNLKTVRIPATVEEVTPDMFRNCPNLTVYVRKSQVSPDFEERFSGKAVVYLDE